jgi:hypothetical protein
LEVGATEGLAARTFEHAAISNQPPLELGAGQRGQNAHHGPREARFRDPLALVFESCGVVRIEPDDEPRGYVEPALCQLGDRGVQVHGEVLCLVSLAQGLRRRGLDTHRAVPNRRLNDLADAAMERIKAARCPPLGSARSLRFCFIG